MNKITVDTTKFSDQLGIYDFFNILVSGAVFTFGVCVINSTFCDFVWKDISFAKGVGIIVLFYVLGLVLQEIGSLADKKGFNIYRSMSRSILKSTFDSCGNEILSNKVVVNALQIKQYRMYADSVMAGLVDMTDNKRFNNDDYNGYFFSVCQYFVAVKGKDKKVEKMRALFDMSRTLTICFLLLSLVALFAFCPHNTTEIQFENVCCTERIIFIAFSVTIAAIFYWRMKKTMHRFLLILLGTYDAILRCEKESIINREKKGDTDES